jgi:TonB family protein
MRILKGFTASILIHVFIFFSCYYMIMWWKNSNFAAVDIDLTSSTLLLRPLKSANKVLQPAVTLEEWFFNDSKTLAAGPRNVSKTAAVEEPAVSNCPAPCPDNPSDWASAGATSRRPVWTDGLITEDDYPKDARAQGKEGVVKVDIYIDSTGFVRDARIISSSDARFTGVVMDKLKKAKFDPALDRSGKPISVHMAVPIVFELH